MINGLGLFAALGSPEPDAAPQPQAGDPALFAAALVAALGLKQPVQIIEPVEAPVPEQEVPDEGEETRAEGDVELKAPVVTESEEPADAAPVIHARVTPDAEAIEESKTLGAVLRAAGKTSEKSESKPVEGKQVEAAPVDSKQADGKQTNAKVVHQSPEVVKGKVVDRTIDEPARPEAKPEASKASHALKAKKEDEASEDLLRADQWSATRHDAASSATQEDVAGTATRQNTPMILPPAPQTMEAAAHPASTPVPEAKQETSEQAAPITEKLYSRADPNATPLPRADQGSATRQNGVTPAPRQDGVSQSQSVVDGDAVVAPDAPVQAPVPPQSNEERTSRAIAENTRLGRQLAEILGEAEVTEFKVQLAPRRQERPASPATPAAQNADGDDIDPPAPVVWQRVAPTASGDTISGQNLPPVPGRTPKREHAPEGSFGREAIVPQPLIQKGQAEQITLSGVTSRSEIVRMVANASRALSPNLTQAEASPSVGKSPAPSITPSLPVPRQEVPDSEPRRAEASGEEPKRAAAREADASDAGSSSSTVPANYSTGNTTRNSAPEGRDVREARNLPSQGSTDGQAAGSSDRVTLQVADDEGRQTRIRVSVTGNQIRAVITPPDSASARQLEQRMDQLHETLVRAGFADPKLVVRAAPESVSDAATMASAASSSQELRSAPPAGRDQPSGEQRQGRGQGQREQDRGDGHRHPQGHSRERDPRDRRR